MSAIARPLSEWTEEDGPALWWRFPIVEAPYVGSPLDLGQTVEVTVRAHGVDKMMRANVGGWPGYHTHWTPIEVPVEPGAMAARQEEQPAAPPIKLLTFPKPKYGEQIVAIDGGSGPNTALFDAVLLFVEADRYSERERVKDQAREFAERFVAQMNAAVTP